MATRRSDAAGVAAGSSTRSRCQAETAWATSRVARSCVAHPMAIAHTHSSSSRDSAVGIRVGDNGSRVIVSPWLFRNTRCARDERLRELSNTHYRNVWAWRETPMATRERARDQMSKTKVVTKPMSGGGPCARRVGHGLPASAMRWSESTELTVRVCSMSRSIWTRVGGK